MNPAYEYIRLENDPKKASTQPDNSFAAYATLIPAKDIFKETAPELNDDEIIIAFGVRLEGVPVGIATASFHPILKRSQIRVFFILEAHNRKEVAIPLMTCLLGELKKAGATGCTFVYIKEEPGTPALEELLQETQWQKPTPFMLRYFFDAAAFNPAWLRLPYRYPKGFKEFFWKDLSKKDREDIERRQDQLHFHTAISPFHNEDILEPLNSVGLKSEGRVVAWILTHRIDKNTIRYSSFYVERPLRHQSLTTKLLAKSIILHKQSPVPKAFVEIPLLLVHWRWKLFVRKRLEPHAEKVMHLLQTWRTL